MESSTKAHYDETDLVSTQILRDFTAGILANCIGTFIGHPLDTVKVRMQLSNSGSSMFGLLTRVVKNEGLTGLFKGVGSPLIGQAPISATAFMSNDFAKRSLANTDLPENQKNFYAGLFTGFATTIFTTPVEYMKIKKQAHSGKGLTYYKIFKSEGIIGSYTGFLATILRDVPGWCAYFYSYDYLKQKFENHLKTSPESNNKAIFLSQVLAGGFAGQLSWLISYPMDVVKSYIQYHPERHSIIRTTRRLYKRNGLNYFFKGVTPCVVRAFPINSVVFVAYEYFVDILNSNSLTD